MARQAAAQPRLTWRAGKDGVGHALATPRALRAVCGARPVDERLAWPMTSKCGDCLAATTGELGL